MSEETTPMGGPIVIDPKIERVKKAVEELENTLKEEQKKDPTATGVEINPPSEVVISKD